MHSTLFSDEYATLAGAVVVNLLWQGTVIGVVVAVALALTRGRSPNVRYAVACAGLLLIAALLPVNFLVLRAGLAEPLPPTASAAEGLPAPVSPENASISFIPSISSMPVHPVHDPAPPTRPSLSAAQRSHLSLPRVVRSEDDTRALFEAFLMSERSLTLLPGDMDLGWTDIPVLLELAEDKTLLDAKNRTFGRMYLTEVPATPITFDPQSWAVRGMVSLWLVEGIRCGYGASFRPPLYAFCLRDNLMQAECEASDKIHEATLAAYQKWWETVRDMPLEEAAAVDPLAGTGLRWCGPQQPRPPSAERSEPASRRDSAAPATPIKGLPEPPFTVEEVAAYHRERTGSDLPADKLKQLCTSIAIDKYSKGGTPKDQISVMKDDARRALAFEQDQLTRLKLYLRLSDGYYGLPDTPWETQRTNMARVMFTGLRELLQLGLPDEPPKMPRGSFYNVIDRGPNREKTMKEIERKQEEQAEAQQKAREIRDLIDYRMMFTRRLVSAYHYRNPSPAAYDELYNLALEYLGNKAAAQQLRYAAENYKGPNSEVPVLRLPAIDE